jgi:outer membrane receptor protein involved in Fe transport
MASGSVNSTTNLLCAALLAAAVAPAWADDPALVAGAPAGDVPEPRLAEVLVTAQRRKENLQNVPISVQVIGSGALENSNFNNFQNLAQVVPSVHIQQGGSSSEIFIRGVGSGEAQQALEQSVGLFVDDMYFGRSRSTTTTFLDLNRIEVLKGPQSTFFGNNAIAGALNVITNKPGKTFGASARLLYGQDEQYAAEGVLNIPLGSDFGARLAVTENGIGGWLKDVATGQTLPTENHLAGRLTLAYAPGAEFDATLKAEASRDRQRGDLHLQIADCPPPAPFSPGPFCQTAINTHLPTYQDNRLGDLEAEESGQGTNIDNTVYELTANYRFSGQTLTSVTGYYRYNYAQNLDLSGTPQYLANTLAPEWYHQLSQELRLASPSDQPIEYLFGLYFQTDHLFYRQDVGYGFLTPVIASIPPFAPLVPYLPIGEAFDYSQQEHSYAGFGALTWNATDRLKLSAGFRWTEVRKSFLRNFYYGTAGSVADPFGPLIPLPAAVASMPAALFGTPVGLLYASRTDSAPLPSARVQYQVSPDKMLYLSYARGFKAGGFNGSDTTGIEANMPFGPEHVDAYEVGFKSEWLHDTLLVNLDAFRSDYSDLQVSVETGYQTGNGVALVRNAASSRSQGVELETRWAATQALRLAANVTYLKSYYVSYPNAAPNAVEQFYHIPVQDLTGKPTMYAPLWSGSLSGDYSVALPRDMLLTAELSPYFTSSYYILSSEDAASRQQSYLRLDARLTLESADGHWAIDLIGKNLTDRQILSFATIYPTSIGSYLLGREEGRNIAGQVRWRW